jgi:hypothetical protein
VPLAATDLDNGQILILIAIIVLPLGAIAFATVGSALKTLGKGQWAIDRELPKPKTLTAPTPVSRAERAAEVRQMLEAKSYRREARGEAPLDIEAELQRLLDEADAEPAAGMSRELREEIRQHVLARNERRMRRGKQPLDVEQEIARQLRDLENLGQ